MKDGGCAKQETLSYLLSYYLLRWRGVQIKEHGTEKYTQRVGLCE